MANIDKISVKNTVYNIVSPAVVSDYIEVIGGACTKPDGYEEDEVILAKQNDVQLLFKATQDIAFGANIVENTNCVRTTLEEVLKNAGGGGGASSADQVSYDNSDSGLEAENVQEAVDELATNAGTASSQIQTLTNQVNAMVNVYGSKNLLPQTGEASSYHGVDFTVNSDGTVNFSGTITDDSTTYNYAVNEPVPNVWKGNTVTFGAFKDTIADAYASLYLYDSSNALLGQILTNGNDLKEANGTIPSNADHYIVQIVLQNNRAVSGTLYPMVRDARIVDSTYEPYSMTNQEMTPYVQAISNPNLLDNPWFTVNQRGFTSGAVTVDTYPLDRWKFADNDSNITVSSGTNGLSIVGTPTNKGENLIRQAIEYDRIPNSVGKVITLSLMLADGTVYKSSHVLVSPTSSWQLQAALDCDTFQVHLLTEGTTPSMFQLFLKSTDKAINTTIRAIKLELGTVSTLAMDTAPNYAEELLKCQRYCRKISLKQAVGYLNAGGLTLRLIHLYTENMYGVTRTAQIPSDFPVTLHFAFGGNYVDLQSADISGITCDNDADGYSGSIAIVLSQTGQAKLTDHKGKPFVIWNYENSNYVLVSADL